MSLPANMSEKNPSTMVYGRASVSPVYPSSIASFAPGDDISRLAGFPQTSHFDREVPESLPASRPRQPPNRRPVNLRLAIPTNAPEAPPPYTQYGHHANPAWNLHPPPRVHMPQPRDSPRRQDGQREPNMIMLGNAVYEHQSKPNGTSYWEAVVGEDGQEKKRLTRRGQICISGVIVLILMTIATVGAVVLAQSTKRKANGPSASNGGPFAMSGFPSLPLGLAVIKPQGRPVVANTCVSPSSMWSCQLPPDSLFPTTPSSSDGSALPEFRFAIAARNSTSNSHELWISIPEKPPNATDYSKLAEADKILTEPKSGEATSYYISLVTEGSSNERTTRTIKRQGGPPPRSMLPVVLRNQPLRFFNRGEKTEHFGFFMYFTKSIRVNTNEGSNEGSTTPSGGLAAGAADGADVRFEKTRFRVAIWTRSLDVGDVELVDDEGRRVNSPAGVNGFPYAVSIIEDRLGDRGSVNQGSGLAKTIIENLDGECRCEWTNFREKV